MFENKQVEGIYYSRFVASWMNARGKIYPDTFKGWLRSLVINGRHLTPGEVTDIYNLASNGKLELEMSAKNYKHKK
jgi:hypothetical protein